MSNSQSKLDNWLDEFIESWIRIEKKDPHWLMEEKLGARMEFKDKVSAYCQQKVTSALAKHVLAGMPELTPKQQDYITNVLANLRPTKIM